MPERLQRLFDTKLELQNERIRYALMENRFLYVLIGAPMWGEAAQHWGGKTLTDTGVAVSLLCIVVGILGFGWFKHKHDHVRRLVGLPKEYISEETAKLLEEESKRPVKVVANPHERATDG